MSPIGMNGYVINLFVSFIVVVQTLYQMNVYSPSLSQYIILLLI